LSRGWRRAVSIKQQSYNWIYVIQKFDIFGWSDFTGGGGGFINLEQWNECKKNQGGSYNFCPRFKKDFIENRNSK
jgi:hypothetical protein